MICNLSFLTLWAGYFNAGRGGGVIVRTIVNAMLLLHIDVLFTMI